ncbi:HAMP domain-containing protein [Pseudodesulfovibrio cashew]|uniref:histidine kinase n=1 Tax=Pseudodesulfovibrio cashew TaxID=2678688 RepID=A0A6I6JBT4_9BACT|nr:HAMP domain-containing sensor histidine kinase [Pseudodesulfovibrio cashew]QGY39541.1 HAMP domain-containing protein [Pseudodesulfovibrio cashew]
MKRLYWKIVVTEGVFLALVIGGVMWILALSHQADEFRREDERKAAIELLKIGLRNDLTREVPLANLEKVASRLFKSNVRIVKADAAGAETSPDAIHFNQDGVPYLLIMSDDAPHGDARGIVSFLTHSKYMGILLVLTMTLGLLAIPLARIVTRPLGRLRRDMRRFASGDLAHRTDVASGDEVGDVARDFNEMAESIQSLVHVGREMTAHVSHELRSPLTRIDVARQVLEEQVSGRPLALLDSIREEVEGMDALIDRILRLSRLELNDNTPAPVCLAELLGEALRRHQASFKANDVDLRAEVPRSLPGVGVKEDLACLVDNLLGNALKFTPRGGHIDVALNRDKDQAVLTVSNEAEKPAVDPARLTEPFQRGAASESVPGSGLGLAIAKRVVDNHGGEMALSWHRGVFSVVVSLPQGTEREG